MSKSKFLKKVEIQKALMMQSVFLLFRMFNWGGSSYSSSRDETPSQRMVVNVPQQSFQTANPAVSERLKRDREATLRQAEKREEERKRADEKKKAEEKREQNFVIDAVLATVDFTGVHFKGTVPFVGMTGPTAWIIVDKLVDRIDPVKIGYLERCIRTLVGMLPVVGQIEKLERVLEIKTYRDIELHQRTKQELKESDKSLSDKEAEILALFYTNDIEPLAAGILLEEAKKKKE